MQVNTALRGPHARPNPPVRNGARFRLRHCSIVPVSAVRRHQRTRDRRFPCDVWSPAKAGGNRPLVAFSHVSMPLSGIRELFERTPATKHMFVLRRADHLHFTDDVAQLHEAVRGMSFPGELAWLPGQMRPLAELCSGKHAQRFVRGLTLCHLDATLRRDERARDFLLGDVDAELARRGIDAFAHRA